MKDVPLPTALHLGSRMVSTTEGEAQYPGRGKTDGTVGARTGRIRSSFGGQRNPICIGVRVGNTSGACCLNSSDRSPELIGVLSFEPCDCSIRHADVQHRYEFCCRSLPDF